MYMTSGIPGTAMYGTFAQPDLTLEQYGRALASVRPNRPVGSSFEYANANYNLLGLIVEAVSGRPYADYVEQQILAPLDMHHTAATPAGERENGLGPGYQWWFGFGPFAADDPYSQANLPTGYMTSTAEDLAHYQIAQINGGRYRSARILSAEGIARMHEAGPNSSMVAMDHQQFGFGMGWGTKVVGDRSTLFYNGETFRFVSHQAIDPQSGWGVVILTNATNQLPSQDEPYHSLVNGVLARVDPMLALPASSEPSLQVAYAIVDVPLALISAWIVWGLLGLPRWSTRLDPRLRAGTGRTRLLLLRVVVEIGVSLGVLLVPPLWLGVGWPVLVYVANDLALWTLLASSLLLVTGLVRGGVVLWALQPRRDQSPILAAEV